MTKPLPARLVALITACRPHPPARPNILKTLLTIQQVQGYVPLAAVPRIAHALGVTEADVAGVLSYYPDLRTVPPGRHVIRVCLGESCLANHCPAVFRAVQAYLACGASGASGADRFTLEKVSCMGNCALSPTVVVDADVHGRVTPERIPALLERYR
jgi:NADH:ubiquinone oxidoreductase subunit E